MSATGRGAIRHALDYYETPLWATRAIVPLLGVPRHVIDLGCGGGAIGHALRLAWGPRTVIVGAEVDPQRVEEASLARTADGTVIYDRVEQRDVLATLANSTPSDEYDLVVANPPYTYAREFIDAAQLLLRPGGKIAFLLRVGFAESVERAEWHHANPSDLHVLSRRPGFYPNNPNAKDSAAYGWFVFGLGHGGRWSVLDCEKPTRRNARAA